MTTRRYHRPRPTRRRLGVPDAVPLRVTYHDAAGALVTARLVRLVGRYVIWQGNAGTMQAFGEMPLCDWLALATPSPPETSSCSVPPPATQKPPVCLRADRGRNPGGRRVYGVRTLNLLYFLQRILNAERCCNTPGAMQGGSSMHGRQHTPNTIHIQGDTAFMDLTNRAGEVIAQAIIDTADVVRVLALGARWVALPHCSGDKYVVSRYRNEYGKQKNIRLHRYLLAPLPNFDVDHINHNPLDNRRSNLRVVTRQQNTLNARPGAYASRASSATSNRYVWRTATGRWRGYVQAHGVRYYYGGYATKEEALTAAECKYQEVAA